MSPSFKKYNNCSFSVTFWNVSDKGGGSSGHSADKGPGPPGQTLIRQAEEVGHPISDAADQAGRTAEDLQGSHHPAWDEGTVDVPLLRCIQTVLIQILGKNNH